LHDEALPPDLSQGGNVGGSAVLYNFMVYQDTIEINLLQLLAHTETSECFFIYSGFSFELNIVGEKKQAS